MTRPFSTTRSKRTVGVLLAVALSALLAGLFAPSVMAQGADGQTGSEVPALGSADGTGAIPSAGEPAPTTSVASPAAREAVPALGSQAGETPLDTPTGALVPAAITDAYGFIVNIVASKADTYSNAPSRPREHTAGGGNYTAGAGDPGQGWTAELLARDFTCSDVVSFLVTVRADGPVPEGQMTTVATDLRFGAASDTAPGAAFNELLGTTVLHDDAAAVEGAAPSSATWGNESFTGDPFTDDAQMDGTLTVTNVERGDFVVVRVDVRLSCDATMLRNGYLYASVQGARETAPNPHELSGSPISVQMIHLSDLNSPFRFSVTAAPTTVVRDRDIVTYTVSYGSIVSDTVATIRTLTDSILGDVTTVQGNVLSTTCVPPLEGPPLGSEVKTCTYTAKSFGDPGTSEVHTVEAGDGLGGFAHDSVTIQIVGANAAVEIDKEFDEIINDADGSGTVTVGDTIRFLITVTNTGDTDLTGVVVTDLLDGATEPQCSNLDGGTLPEGGVATCNVDYTITAADAVNGGVENTAMVETNETEATTGSVGVSVSQSTGAPATTPTTEEFIPLADTPPPPSPTQGATVIASQLPFTGADTVRVVSFAVAILAAGAAFIVWGASARRPVRPLGC